MITGIYCLYWENDDRVYIGQSTNIHKRYKEHISKLKLGRHTNYKLYSLFKIKSTLPKLLILEESKLEYLDRLEIYWTNEFNSIDGGLNIIEPGVSGGFGVHSSQSKYTKIQILKVFKELSRSYYTYTTSELSMLYKVHTDTIVGILSGRIHCWLKEEFPFHYAKMLLYRDERIKKNKVAKRDYGSVHGEITLVNKKLDREISISNITKFAKENNLSQAHLSKIINGSRKTHKGWQLK